MRLYNTLSRETEEFTVVDGVVKMYVCGITPYAPSHVGHALRGVVFDVLRRYLQYRGHEVRHVENFTDIDDKMINGAKQEGISTSQLAERNIEDYFHVMDGLNVLRAHAYPRATEEIPRICEIIETLREKECAYAVGGDVYFSVRSDPDYGKLSRRSLEEMRAGARVEVDEKKTDVMDFALWKSQKPGEPAWDSPWGPGRPGWHIECSAMAMSHLGTPVDVHGGGQDLVFPHHENEIAQTESYDEQRALARFWVHNGLLRIGDETMSKSLGNFVTVTEALNSYSADALRLFFLSSHYRSPLTYSAEAVLAQERAAERLRNAAHGDGVDDSDAGESELIDVERYRDRFLEAMDEDLNTPRALATLFDLAREINRTGEAGGRVSEARSLLRELSGVLGLTLEEPAASESGDVSEFDGLLDELRADLEALADGSSLEALTQRLDEATGADQIVRSWLDLRSELRTSRQFDLADRIRDGLASLGVTIEDKAGGTDWRRTGR